MNDSMHLRGSTVDHVALPFNSSVLELTILNTVVWFIKFFLFKKLSNLDFFPFCRPCSDNQQEMVYICLLLKDTLDRS